MKLNILKLLLILQNNNLKINFKVKLYEKYIFNKTLQGFASILFLLVSLIWFSKTISFVKYITENGIELSQFLFLFILILPWLLMFIIPISLFAAILIVFNRLNSNNEIAILKNAGLVNMKISKPALKVAFYAALFCFFISFFLMPYSNKKLRLTRIDFENNYSNISFSEGVFENLKSLTIYVREKDKNGQLFGILLHDERQEEYSMTITSESGNLSFENDNLLLYMQKGTVQRFNKIERKSEFLTFDDYVFNLSENNDAEKRSMRWKPKERYINELLYPKEGENTTKEDMDKYKAEIQQRITYPLMSITMSLIALSALLSGNFNRKGSNLNIFLAISSSILFLMTTISIYRIIESKPHLTILLYLTYTFFIAISVKILLSKKYTKK